MRRVIIFCTAVLCVLPGAMAQSRVLSLEQLVTAADVVVHGVVASTTCERDAAGRILTRVTLRATDVWKGATSNIPIVHAGGVLGEEAVFAHGQERYAAGEEIVAFLKLNERGEGVTIGMSQGKFNVYREAARKLVRSSFHGASGKADGREDLALGALKRIVQGGRR